MQEKRIEKRKCAKILVLHNQAMKISWRAKNFIICIEIMRWWTMVFSLVPPKASTSRCMTTFRSSPSLQVTVRNYESVKIDKNGGNDSTSGLDAGPSPLANNWNNHVQPICRVVTRANSKLPTNPSILPASLFQNPRLIDKLNAYYSALAHRTTSNLEYMHEERESQSQGQSSIKSTSGRFDPRREAHLAGVIRTSLEDAGFELLNRRDIDLCDSLNAGYLLRLSIVPDVSELDESIAQEFYPERFHRNGTMKNSEDMLFDGRVLVYWRGYSEEVTEGHLLLPKLDYLQASLVQRLAAWVKQRLDRLEDAVARKFSKESRKLKSKARKSLDTLADSLLVDTFGISLPNVKDDSDNTTSRDDLAIQGNGRFKLGRYGGSKVRFVGSPNPNDALDPFTICEIFDEQGPSASSNLLNATIIEAEDDMRNAINRHVFTCEYDGKVASGTDVTETPRMELLRRVSINNLVDLFTKAGRRKVVQAIFEKSKLVEPTYEEVVVVWRPKVHEKPDLRPPKWISDLADMLDVEGFEQPPANRIVKRKAKIEIRNFEGVPMANLPAVLPKTRLVFRPADAFLFDLVSFVTFFLVVGSIRLDSPRLDLLALVSVSLWIMRTVFRYSNKLARYDLLVKSFLTSKIAHRNSGALKYIVAEAGSQRAVRTALVYMWISNFVDAIKSPFQRTAERTLTRTELRVKAQDEINNLLNMEKQVQVHVERALEDLEELQVVTFNKTEPETLVKVLDPMATSEAIKQQWVDFYDNIDSESFGGTNSSLLSKSSWRAPVMQVQGRVDHSESDCSIQPLNDSEDQRRRLAASFAKSENIAESSKMQNWQKGITISTLTPALDGPSCQDQNRWQF